MKKSLFNKKNLDNAINLNKYYLSEYDMIGDLEGFPVGLVVRMMEEQEKQGNKPDVKVFQDDATVGDDEYGFTWAETEDEWDFWKDVISNKNFNLFFKRYPEYKNI